MSYRDIEGSRIWTFEAKIRLELLAKNCKTLKPQKVWFPVQKSSFQSTFFFLPLTESFEWWKLCVKNENLQWRSDFYEKVKSNRNEKSQWMANESMLEWFHFSAIKHRKKVIYTGTGSEVKWERKVYEKQLNVYKVERQTRSSNGFASHHWICCWVIQIL